MNKKLVYSLAVIAIFGLGVAGYVSAGQQMPMYERFAQRFNLDEGEVEDFFSEVGQERFQFMQEKQEERLDSWVEQGSITEEQKELVLAKKEEMREKNEALRDLDPEQRKDEMQALRQEMREWAEENDLNMRFFGDRTMGFHKGPRGGSRDCLNNPSE